MKLGNPSNAKSPYSPAAACLANTLFGNDPAVAERSVLLDRRNRRNAQYSTGPVTLAGKAVVRINALRHGLTANPAVGAVEETDAFETLLEAVAGRLRPADVIEEALVHRIAVAIWRQRRAVRAETALSSVVVRELVPQREEVQRVIAEITNAWVPVATETPQRDPDTRRVIHNLPPIITWSRPKLAKLDLRREDEYAASGAAITAMATMIESLAERLESRSFLFTDDQAEQLSWLMGDIAGFFPQDSNCRFEERPGLTKAQRLIAEAMARPEDGPIDRQLVNLITNRLDVLDHQRHACEHPYSNRQHRYLAAAALLPDAVALDRLLRYETHADKTLARALDTLARLRGVTVERLSTTVTARLEGADSLAGTMVQVEASKVEIKLNGPQLA